MVDAIRSINAFSVVCEFATVQRFGLYDIAPTVAFIEQLPTGRTKQCVLNCNSDGKELSTFFSKMDSSWIDNIFWCLQIGLFFLNGCSGAHHRKSNQHLDPVWRAVNISLESPGPHFVVHPSHKSESTTDILQRPFLVGYPSIDSSIITTSYGPFITKQTHLISEGEANSDFFVKSHIIDDVIHRHTPSVRVLFHLEKHKKPIGRHKTKICIIAELEYMGTRSSGSCTPKGHPATCIANVDVLLAWKAEDASPIDVPVTLNLSYAVVASTENSGCMYHEDTVGQFIGTVEVLDGDEANYSRVTEDRFVHMDVPMGKIGLEEKFEIPIIVHRQYQCTLRARTKEGIKITKIKYTDVDLARDMSMVRSKGTFGMATASKQMGANIEDGQDDMHIVMAMEFEILNHTESVRRISWRVDCEKGKDRHASKFDTEIFTSHQNIKEFLPVIKSTEIVNTAVLNGVRVHYPVRVFAVSHGGDVFVITDRLGCQSSNSSIVKVDSDCSVIYVNGSETEGSESVAVVFTYAGTTVDLPLRVWMPELPVSVTLSDKELSLVKRWKVARKDGYETNEENELNDNDSGGCHLTYQTAIAEVLTRFYIPTGDKGSRQYFSGAHNKQVITEVVGSHLKAENKHVVHVDGRRVTGLTPGTTTVQVIHPHTKDVLGETKVHVLNDKVEIVDMKVTMVTGMKLESTSVDEEHNLFGYNLIALDGFVTRHQEAFLYVTITFDDLTMVALQDLDPSSYSLKVSSTYNEVLAPSPDFSSKFPSVITTGQGTTGLVVSFLPSSECQRKRKENCIIYDAFTVAVTYNSSHGFINEIANGNNGEPWVRFSSGMASVDPGVVRTDVSQYYVRQLPPASQDDMCESSTILIDSYYWDDHLNPRKPVDGSQNNGEKNNSTIQDGDNNMTEGSAQKRKKLSLVEIIMYVVLSIFGLAVLVFIINFLMFIVRYLRQKKPSLSDGIHPQRWIMLGVDWDKQQGNFPLPSDESFHLQESTEGSGREDLSSTVSGATVPRMGQSESDEPSEGDPLIQRLNNGAVVREISPNRSDERVSRDNHSEAVIRNLPQTCENHEMQYLTHSHNNLENIDNERKHCDGENPYDRRTPQHLSNSSLKEEAVLDSEDLDAVLSNIHGMMETPT